MAAETRRRVTISLLRSQAVSLPTTKALEMASRCSGELVPPGIQARTSGAQQAHCGVE